MTAESLLLTAIGALVTAIGILWRESVKWQTKWQQEHDKRIQDLKEHDATSAKFLLALERLQSESLERLRDSQNQIQPASRTRPQR